MIRAMLTIKCNHCGCCVLHAIDDKELPIGWAIKDIGVVCDRCVITIETIAARRARK